MTSGELQEEWNYRYHERTGILCGTDQPTPEQDLIARKEADDAIRELLREPDELIL